MTRFYLIERRSHQGRRHSSNTGQVKVAEPMQMIKIYDMLQYNIMFKYKQLFSSPYTISHILLACLTTK